jgi:hypothetical protein
MKWKTKKPGQSEPEKGDTRWVDRFAWIPTPLDDGHTVFLEKYRVEQQYKEVDIVVGVSPVSLTALTWKDVRSYVIEE